ncbi:MAG TPA: Grx4 family monothiol glutaredoxin [Candidatus Competibacteraceae bacterium]|nr:MAG: Grx4 family monothiol glutaredoxin [Candidatus Competibacteraceae bacterium]HOB61684.1 Grx4 family monothiol glutaredoxin [Candidatus Competibacteraceae bacterium]HQA26387.1 Grx4 family monothiol glutaredoxin [Candidatus Competibacteraceae bacterium]HQD57277.1 Grx4 family monothiol glutaredoxin [Candidatus Competibacteraceae bacterium]
MDVLERIKGQVESNPVVIYMKGTPEAPRCGFSHRASQALAATGLEFAYVNVLEDPEIFENLPRYADWPTFPQIYIDGELVGGCDITLELYQNGELQKLMEAAVGKAKDSAA